MEILFISRVTIWSVFQNPVTYKLYNYIYKYIGIIYTDMVDFCRLSHMYSYAWVNLRKPPKISPGDNLVSESYH